jgi:SNF2 family DNA or RNA helicase
MQFKPWSYQDFAIRHMKTNKGSGPLMDMGLGKTVCALTVIDDLIYDTLEVNKALVIAPKRVVENTWPEEIAKWDHTKHLKYSLVIGTELQRKEALKVKADIYIIGRQNTDWLVSQYGATLPFDLVILDESSSFKNPKSKRFKAIRTALPWIKRRIILTGTPTPNGLLDIWAQMFFLDKGLRLGARYEDYQDKYFKKKERGNGAAWGYEMRTFAPPRKRADGTYNTEEKYRQDLHDLLGRNFFETEIHDKIGDICFSMKSEDYLDMPKRIDRTISVKLSAEMQQKYDEFERDRVLELLNGEEVTALNAAAINMKLLQFSSGAVYDADKKVHVVHDEKLEALEETVEAANGQPVLIAYYFKHELERIKEHLKAYRPRELITPKDMQDWNAGKIQVALGHPDSIAYGLNLQFGGGLSSGTR